MENKLNELLGEYKIQSKAGYSDNLKQIAEELQSTLNEVCKIGRETWAYKNESILKIGSIGSLSESCDTLYYTLAPYKTHDPASDFFDSFKIQVIEKFVVRPKLYK